MDDHSFHKIDLTCGGPQGFILGPIPFSLYVLPFCIIGHNKINFHNHADDTHLFISVSMNDYSFIKNMIACISDISLWMTLNFLPLNQDKTHILVIGAKETDYLKLFAQQHTLNRTSQRHFLDLNFECHIGNLTKVSFYYLKNIASQTVSLPSRHRKV